MKKLLIAMMSVASLVFVAKAELLGAKSTFEGMTAGEAFDTTVTESTTADASITRAFWAGTAGDSIVKEHLESDQSWGGNNFLSVDSSEGITRNADMSGGDAVPQTLDATGTVVDMKVQFTPTDVDAEVSTEDKLIVWLKQTDTEGETKGVTNLMVTAGVLNEEGRPATYGAFAITGYADGSEFVTPTTNVWYRLTIKGYTEQKIFGELPVTVAMFKVYLDGNQVVAGDQAAFPSLVNDYANSKLTSISFKGTGAVDNLEFTNGSDNPDFTVEEAAPTFALTVNVVNENNTALEVDENNGPLYGFEITGITGVTPGSTNEVEVGTETVEILVTVDPVVSTVSSTLGTVAFVDEEHTLTSVTVDTSALTKGAECVVTITVSSNGGSGSTGVTPTIDPANTTWADSKGPQSTYEVGDVIDPTALEAVASGSHKRAVVTVKVNGTEITEAYTIKGGETVIIKVTEEDITFALTIPEVTGATGAANVEDVTAIVEGTEVTVTWTAAEGYKITAGATQTITMTEDTTAATPTVKAIEYATVTITQVDNCTITVKKGDDTVESGTKFDKDDAVELTVTRAAAEGYELDGCKASETVTMTADTIITAAVKASGSTPTLPTYIEGKSEVTIAKYNAWAETYGDDIESANEEAYLLNCAPTEAAVAAAKAAFKFAAITPGEVPEIDGTGYNGVVVILGGTSLADIADWDEATETDNFFKATLVVEKAAK